MAVCARCGEDNPDRARFCLACGAPLRTDEPPRELRRTVTILFCDLIDSTPLGERLDPEAWQDVLRRYHAEMRTVIERHGGTVEKFIGDAVMAVFGVPTLREDDALRAVRAACEMREALADLNEGLRRERGVRLSTRVGVNTGEVIAGDPSAGHAFVTGDPVVVAERLEKAASADDILIGEVTLSLVSNAVIVEPLEPLTLKGKAEPVPAWRVLGVLPGAPGFARRLASPMIGRETELGQLRQAFERAVRSRTCYLFTVLGAAGIGKSRLAGELMESVADEATILTGRCLPYGEGITYFPLADMVRQAAEITADLSRDDALGRLRAIVPGDEGQTVCDRLAAAVGLSDGAAVREETFWAVRKLLEALAAERPLVLIFDDLQWAEPTLLDLIEYLADWVQGAPVLVVCLARGELLDSRPTWGGGKLNATSVLLEPLSETDARRMIENLAGDEGVASAVATRIATAAEGNPLFVEQMLAIVAEDDGAAAVAAPPTIQALIAARLERLPREERAVVELASIVGRVFPRAAVEALGPDALQARLDDHLLTLMRKELIRRARATGGDETYRFRHLLIRDAAYFGMAKRTRADLHERFASWLEQRPRDTVPAFEEIVGYHFEQAYRHREDLGLLDERARGIAARAGELLGAAGRRAVARDDMPAALNLVDRAVSLMMQEDPARQELERELSNALFAVGELARAEALLDGLIQAASAAGNRRIEWYALLDRAAYRAVKNPEASEEELRLARDAVAVFEELGDDLGLARAWRRISAVLRARADYEASEDAIARALAHARRAGDGREEARSSDLLCTILLYGPAPAASAARRCEEMLRRAGNNRLLEANVASSLSGLVAMTGRFDDARELYRRARAIYEDLGLRLPLAGLTQIGGVIELLAGDAAAAEHELRQGLEILEPFGATAYQAGLLAQAVCVQGRHDDADDCALRSAAAPQTPSSQVLWRCVRAKVAARRGDSESAMPLAREALTFAAETHDLNLQADAFVDFAGVARLVGAEDEAAEAFRTARQLYERKGNVVGVRKTAALIGAPVR